MREISTLQIMDMLDLLMQIRENLSKDKLYDRELDDCCHSAQGLLMSIFHKDSLSNEWGEKLNRLLNNAKETKKELER